MIINKIIRESNGDVKEIPYLNNNKKVFLGGTCNNSNWRNELIKYLKIDYFNPVVEDWTEENQKEELRQRDICDYLLYVITPKMKGVYSIAELIDDSNKHPKKTIFCYITKDEDEEFNKAQIKSLEAVGNMVINNNASFVHSLKEVADIVNGDISE